MTNCIPSVIHEVNPTNTLRMGFIIGPDWSLVTKSIFIDQHARRRLEVQLPWVQAVRAPSTVKRCRTPPSPRSSACCCMLIMLFEKKKVAARREKPAKSASNIFGYRNNKCGAQAETLRTQDAGEADTHHTDTERAVGSHTRTPRALRICRRQAWATGRLHEFTLCVGSMGCSSSSTQEHAQQDEFILRRFSS